MVTSPDVTLNSFCAICVPYKICAICVICVT